MNSFILNINNLTTKNLLIKVFIGLFRIFYSEYSTHFQASIVNFEKMIKENSLNIHYNYIDLIEII